MAPRFGKLFLYRQTTHITGFQNKNCVYQLIPISFSLLPILSPLTWYYSTTFCCCCCSSSSSDRISTFLLYFLLPTDAKYIPHKIPVDDPSSNDDSDNNGDDDDDDDDDGKKAITGKSKSGTKVVTTTKKRSAPVPKIASSAVGSTNKKSKTTKNYSSNAAGSGADNNNKNEQQGQAAAAAAAAAVQPNTLKEKNNNLTKEIELLSVEVLLQKMDTAISNGLWERKHQIIGSTLCYHAVRSAGASKEIQQEIVHNIETTTGTAADIAAAGGVSRTTIMEWIEQSKKYRKWVQQVRTHMTDCL